MDQVRCGAVDADHAAAGFASDGVGFQAGAVGDVDDADQFTGQDVRGGKQVGVHRHRTDVVQIRLRYSGPVDLGFEHGALHGIRRPWMMRSLSNIKSTL
ncbi:hypothetical protein D3C74_442890 [compost metagenome]